jgi:hypothetical protein
MVPHHVQFSCEADELGFGAPRFSVPIANAIRSCRPLRNRGLCKRNSLHPSPPAHVVRTSRTKPRCRQKSKISSGLATSNG